MRRHHNPEAPEEVVVEKLPTYDYNRVVFTEGMRKTYKILVPQMSPLHFSLLEPVLKNEGYDFEKITIEDVNFYGVGYPGFAVDEVLEKLSENLDENEKKYSNGAYCIGRIRVSSGTGKY